MVDMQHTAPPPEIHTLAGSSEPTGAPPAFEPVATGAAPPVSLSATLTWLDEVGESSYERQAHPEADLIEACGGARAVFEDYEKAWNALSDSQVGDLEGAATEESHRLGAELEAVTKQLAKRSARTPEGLAFKASLILDIMDQNSVVNAGDLTDHVALVKSVLEDARWIGTVSRFTLTQLVGVEPTGPVQASADTWALRHRVQDWARVTLSSDWLFDQGVAIDNLMRKTGIPPALFVRTLDAKHFDNVNGLPEIDEVKWFGDRSTIHSLRKKLDGSAPPPTRAISDPAGREHRIAQILKAYDAWPSKDLWRAAEDMYEASNRKGTEINSLREQVEDMAVDSLDGLILKCQIFAAGAAGSNEEALMYLEERCAPELAATRSMKDIIIRDLMRLVVQRQMSVRILASEFRDGLDLRPDVDSDSRSAA